jgi:predicted PurR-regulated permease PerM
MSEIRFWRAVGSLLALGLVIAFIIAVWQVLVPFLLGFAVAYLVSPLVDRFVAVGLRRDRTVLVLYVFLLGATAGVGSVVVPSFYREAYALADDIPKYTAALDQAVERLNDLGRESLRHVLGPRAESFSLPFRSEQFLESLVKSLSGNLLQFLSAGVWIFVIPFVSFFALSQSQRWIDALFAWVPAQKVEGLLGFLAEINAALGGYVRGQALDAICVGLLTMGGLALLGFDGAVIVGGLTGFLNLVPFMAPLVGGSIALLAGYFQGLSFPVLVGIFLLFALVRLLDDFVLTPFVVGSSVRLHPVAVLFAVLAGFHVAGFLGLVFAVPIAAIVKVIAATALGDRRETLVVADRQLI